MADEPEDAIEAAKRRHEEEESDDPWLDQFMAGAARREQRANETGWGCAIAIGLAFLIVLMLIAASHKP